MYFLGLAAFIVASFSIYFEYYLIVFFLFTACLVVTKILESTPGEEQANKGLILFQN